MGNPETKATLGYDIIQRQANEKNTQNNTENSINNEINKIKNA